MNDYADTTTKVLINGKEYLRIDGIWFRWDDIDNQYVVENKPEYNEALRRL